MAEQTRVSGDSAGQLPDLSESANVLFLAPSVGSQSAAGFELLTRSPLDQTTLIVVTYTGTARGWVDDWTERVGEAPARGGIVTVGERDVVLEDSSWAARAIDNPSDLTGIGIELSELLSGAATAEDTVTVVWFDSITSLLQYADLQRAFRFLHVVTGRVKTVGGTGFYRLDPDAHDSQTIATMKGLFDAVISRDEDGTWTTER